MRGEGRIIISVGWRSHPAGDRASLKDMCCHSNVLGGTSTIGRGGKAHTPHTV